MSVKIKCMDLPSSCDQCRFAVDGWCYANDRANVEPLSRFDRPKWCPLDPDEVPSAFVKKCRDRKINSP